MDNRQSSDNQTTDELYLRRFRKLSSLSLQETQKIQHHLHPSYKPQQQQQHFQTHRSKMKTILTLTVALTICQQAFTCRALETRGAGQSTGAQQVEPFPGVSRDLSAFCSGRPSLAFDLAAMVVHVKRNVSFNYKLYLFSGDHVFQTGQVIPRDDFRIHSFPVKLKPVSEFWSHKVDTFRYTSQEQPSATAATAKRVLVRVPSDSFDLKQFLRPVPLNPPPEEAAEVERESARPYHRHARVAERVTIDDLHGEVLPGDPQPATGENFNTHIEFDRDDQVSVAKSVRSVMEHQMDGRGHSATSGALASAKSAVDEETMVPVGAFSSFHVNLTYLVRKDFGQAEPELVRLQIDAANFVVNQLVIINDGSTSGRTSQQSRSDAPNYSSNNEDHAFLQHKLIRDPNTRITAINQIYEDWITRNFYTIVYVQRKLSSASNTDYDTDGEPALSSDEAAYLAGKDRASRAPQRNKQQQQVIVSDRLVFRGTSAALLGAEQLDYNVKATAFIMEKNGLHYYLEFLTTGKFYLCAVDWTKRPFKMIDSRSFPIKATKTLLDNEELLLCPPAICYSDRPVDEIVGYGRIVGLDGLRSGSSDGSRTGTGMSGKNDDVTALIRSTNGTNATAVKRGSTRTEADVAERLRAASRQLETRLHLRDWAWTMPRRSIATAHSAILSNLIPVQVRPETLKASTGGGGGQAKHKNSSEAKTSFEWRYEQAKRNDIKAKPDTYGYVLTGHEIDASYRVNNELYLVSANHLITINYTLANETVTSNQLLGDEFFGLSSTLLEPITGAFYDRYANQIFFFKGDRYIGYNYASKKPLDDFALEAPLGSMELDPIGLNTFNGGPLVSSLPVVSILGRQHEVDGVYHDLASDVVYIFSGMKFYKFPASEFKDGTFKPARQTLPPMECMNEHFIQGCHFDRAFPNPCKADVQDDETGEERSNKITTTTDVVDLNNQRLQQIDYVTPNRTTGDSKSPSTQQDTGNFYDEQQMKLRSIATRKQGIMNIITGNPLRQVHGAITGVSVTEITSQDNQTANAQTKVTTKSQENVFLYLLVTLIALTILVTILVIMILLNWSKPKLSSDTTRVPSLSPAFVTSSNYMSNQRDHLSRHLAQSQPATNIVGRATMATKPLSHINGTTRKMSAQDAYKSDITDSSAL